MKNSIRVKVFKYFAFFGLALILLMWLFQIVFLNDFYRVIREYEVRNYASEIAKSASFTNQGKDELSAYIIENGEIVKTGQYQGFDPHNQFDVQSIYQEIIQNDTVSTYYDRNGKLDKVSNTNRPTKYIYGIKIADNKAVVVIARIQPLTATSSTLMFQLGIITVIMILMIILFVMLLSHTIVKPIEVLKEDAEKLGHGDYDIQKKNFNYQEISELSSTLEYAGKQLSKVDKLQNEFISNITHDLKTPLTLIEGYAQLMIDIPNENNAENAQIIVDEAKRLTSLVQGILEISKIKSQSEIMSIQKYNLNEIIKEVVDSVQNLVKKDGYQILYNGFDIAIECDRYYVKQAIYNLIINAIHYTGKDKIVKIEIKTIDTFVKVLVCDSGEGIKQEDLPYIFDRYYQENTYHRRSLVSSGVGLSIVKTVMKMHQGSVDVTTSETGSTFILNFNQIKK